MLLKRHGANDSEGIEVKYVTKLSAHLDHLEPNFQGYDHLAYLSGVLHPLALAEYVQRAAAALAGHKYDALACRGISGMAFTFPLTLMVGAPAIVVRKGESNHGQPVEGFREAKKYIIVDDFSSSGETACAIIQSIELWGCKAKCLGILQVTRLPVIKEIQKSTPWPLYRPHSIFPDATEAD